MISVPIKSGAVGGYDGPLVPIRHAATAPSGVVPPVPPVNPGDMDWWITDRIPFDTANPPSGNTGSMDYWITDRISFDEWAGV